MTAQDIAITALTCWREARGGRPQPDAMQAVMNVICNRSAKTGESPYTVCTTHAQFSSISEPGPEAYLWPVAADPQWVMALSLASQAAAGTLADLTNGSTLYYAPYSIHTTATFTLPNGTVVPFPEGWNASVVTYEASIGGQLFFFEK